MMTKKRAQRFSEFQEQQMWIEEHGGSRWGYVQRYGSRDEANHYGNGGEAIYAADVAELHRRHEAWKRS